MKKTEKRENGSIRVATVNDQPSKAAKQFKEQCDINHIMARYKKTGMITHVNNKQGRFIDVVGLPDYQTSLNQIIQANDAFSQLPAQIRKRFANNPQNLIDFLSDEKNREEADKLGLTTPKTNANDQTNANEGEAKDQKSSS